MQGKSFGLQRKYNKYYSYLEYRKNIISKRISKYRGISKGGKKWYAVIIKDGKLYRSHLFKTQLQAALKHDELAKELYGNRANLNFPNAINTSKI